MGSVAHSEETEGQADEQGAGSGYGEYNYHYRYRVDENEYVSDEAGRDDPNDPNARETDEDQ